MGYVLLLKKRKLICMFFFEAEKENRVKRIIWFWTLKVKKTLRRHMYNNFILLLFWRLLERGK